MSAKTAIHMLAPSNTASARNTALMPRASAMFCHSTACVRRDSRTSSASRRGSSFITTTSAASMATWVPPPPMATPMSAPARAGRR
jgi:hypothetical protein